MENPIKMDDLGVPLFWETPKYRKNLSIAINLGVYLLSNLRTLPQDLFYHVLHVLF